MRPPYWLFILAGLIVIGLVARSLARQRRSSQAQKAALEQLGFSHCPDRKGWLEETVTRIENNRGYRYEVRDPKRLRGEPAVYHYVKVRHCHDEGPPLADEEILFPVLSSKDAVEERLERTLRGSIG